MSRHRLVKGLTLLAAVCSWGSLPDRTPAAPAKDKTPPTPAATAAPGVIKSEANMVLVDVVVTDKHRHYLQDLAAKEFHVFEDGVEQPIVSFSREANIAPEAPDRRKYMVLFFDNAGLGVEDQMWERDAAAKFVEGTASSHRLMAVMDYIGTLQVDQTFTANADLLREAVRSPKFSHAATNQTAPAMGGRSMLGIRSTSSGADQKQADMALRNLLLAMREVAKMLSAAPGRKTLIFLSAGFNLTSERQADFQDTIDALNMANVGVYPVDPAGFTSPASVTVRRMGTSASEASPVLYALAAKTGGFPVVNTNDLQGGMNRISAEMNEYYLLGYVPPHPSHAGREHRIRVKVDRPGAEVRARSGYSDTPSPDALVGTSEGTALETKAADFEAGEIPVSLTTPYFYLRPGIARVNLTLSIPGSAVSFRKHGEKFQSQLNILGVATRDNGSVAARFSDTMNLDYEKDERQDLAKGSFPYQNSFKIATGEYTFKLVLTAGGEKFGKYVVPLLIDPFSGKEFTLTGPAFGDGVVPSPLSAADIDQGLVQGSTPMVVSGLQLVPSSSNRFERGTTPEVYVEVYDPLLPGGGPETGVLFDIVSRQTHQKVYSSNTLPINELAHAGSPLVPVMFPLPIEKLAAGSYVINVWARDSAQHITPVRTGEFSVE